jgi:hypothetical protein
MIAHRADKPVEQQLILRRQCLPQWRTEGSDRCLIAGRQGPAQLAHRVRTRCPLPKKVPTDAALFFVSLWNHVVGKPVLAFRFWQITTQLTEVNTHQIGRVGADRDTPSV